MTQSESRVCILVRVNELIVQLKNVFGGIESARAVCVHDEMGQRLVREKIRFTVKLEEPAHA